MSSKDLTDKAVLKYLEQKGYARIAHRFKRELNGEKHIPNETDLGGLALDVSLANHNYQHRLISSFNQHQLDTKSYSQAYMRLEAIVNECHLYARELKQLLWPVLVHLYLELHTHQHTSAAHDLLEQHRPKDMTTDIKEQVAALRKIRTQAQASTNQWAVHYRKKVTITISEVALAELGSRLANAKDMLLSRVINQAIIFEVPVVQSDELETDDSESFLGQPVHWGVLEDVARCHREAREKIMKRKRMDEAQDDEVGDSAAKTRALLAVPLPTETMKSSIPLPETKETSKQTLINDLSWRQTLGVPAPLPSVSFFTFLNSRYIVNSTCISEDGSKIAVGLADSTIRYWDMTKIGAQQIDPTPHPGWKSRPEVDQENERLPEELRARPTDPNVPGFASLIGHSGPVCDVAFSPDQRFLLSGSEDSSVRLWDLESRLNLVSYKGHNYPVWKVAFSPVGFYFATASFDGTARLWSTDKIFALRMFVGHTDSVDCVTFHPNCNYVATGSSDKTIRLWDVKEGKTARLFVGHKAAINEVAISPNGKFLASASDDGEVKLWDVSSSKLVKAYPGHQAGATCVAFSGESSILASGGRDHTLRLWCARGENTNLENDCIRVLRAKNSPISSLRFTKRNLLLASGIFQGPEDNPYSI